MICKLSLWVVPVEGCPQGMLIEDDGSHYGAPQLAPLSLDTRQLTE